MNTDLATSAFNVATFLAAQARRRPSHPALRSTTHSLDFADLMTRARLASAALAEDGIAPGTRVGIAMPDPVLSVLLTVAVWLRDATPVILDARSRAAERARVARFLDIATVLQSRPPPGAETFPALDCDAAWWDALSRRPPPPEEIPTARAPAMITLSSGPTGLPMGTGFTHDRYIARLALQRQPGIFWPGQVFLNPLSVAFSASVNHTFNHLFAGNCVAFASPLSAPAELADAIRRSKASVTFLTRPQLDGLLSLDGPRVAGDALDIVFSGGAYLPEALLEAAMDRIAPTLAYSYSSGVSGQVAIATGAELRANRRSVGHPLPGVLVEIRAPDGRRCAPGETGMIRVASPGIASFVLSHADRSGQDRLEDRWAVPGDLGFLDETGALTITGRAGSFLIRGGVTLFPEEIEAVLQDCPNLAQVAIAPVPSATHGEDLVALVVPRGPLRPSDVVAFARAHLSPSKCPQHVAFVAHLPFNANGKIDRAAARALAATHAGATADGKSGGPA